MRTGKYKIVETINSYKLEMGCTGCDYDKSVHALVLYPLEPRAFNVELPAQHVGRTTDEIIAEVQKCTVLCKNCREEAKSGLFDAGVLPRIVVTPEDERWFERSQGRLGRWR